MLTVCGEVALIVVSAIKTQPDRKIANRNIYRSVIKLCGVPDILNDRHIRLRARSCQSINCYSKRLVPPLLCKCLLTSKLQTGVVTVNPGHKPKTFFTTASVNSGPQA